MTSTTDNASAIEVALERATSLAAVLTIALLVMSVSHEWGYFWIVGSHFQTFISTIDYFANGVLWLPAGLFFIYGNVDWWRMKDSPPKKKNWKNWKTWIWPILVVIIYAFVFLTAQWPPSFFVSFNLLVVSIFIWSKIWRRVLAPNAKEMPFGSLISEVARVVPPAMIGMFVWGLINATSDLASTSDPYIVTAKADTKSHDLKILLRSFDKGLLVKNPKTNRIEFIKWDNISAIEKPIQSPSRSFACYAFDFCPSFNTTTP